MAVEYCCDNCHKTSADLDGWTMVAIQFLHNDARLPTPPGGRTLSGTLPDLFFDKDECLDAWCKKAGIDRSTAVAPPGMQGIPPEVLAAMQKGARVPPP